MAKYNLTTEDYENLAADAKATLLRYIEGEGDSDQYDSEGEEETYLKKRKRCTMSIETST